MPPYLRQGRLLSGYENHDSGDRAATELLGAQFNLSSAVSPEACSYIMLAVAQESVRNARRRGQNSNAYRDGSVTRHNMLVTPRCDASGRALSTFSATISYSASIPVHDLCDQHDELGGVVANYNDIWFQARYSVRTTVKGQLSLLSL